jgi:TRAP-type uncharacterized transport system fused permease subunit
MGTEERTIAKKYRRPTKTLKFFSILLPFLAITICVLVITHAISILEFAYLYLLLLLLLPLCFIWIPPGKSSDRLRLPWYDLLLACLSFFLPLYFFRPSSSEASPRGSWACPAIHSVINNAV